MHPRAARGGQFCRDEWCSAIVQGYGIITRANRLVIVPEDDFPLVTTGDRQQGDVAQVTDARATQVLVPEADQHRVAVVIARAPVPAACGLGGTQLDVAEGHVRPEEHMAMPARADAGIDPLGEIHITSDSCQAGYSCNQR